MTQTAVAVLDTPAVATEIALVDLSSIAYPIWHMSGSHFRDYHLLLDDQAEQIFDMTDEVAERARKIGGTTLR